MGIFKALEKFEEPVTIYKTVEGYESVVFHQNKKSGLQTIIAIHDTTLGPALGGCRLLDYHSEEEALVDVLRLSKGMTYKAALPKLPFGGGKAVILSKIENKNRELLHAFGEFLNSFNGSYLSGEDMQTTLEDMRIVREKTEHVVGVKEDPSPRTAEGVYNGIKACLEIQEPERYPTNYNWRYGYPLKGKKVLIQGLGKVGKPLLKKLAGKGATLIIVDKEKEVIEEALKLYKDHPFGISKVEPGEEYDTECDIFSPCATGGILNTETIPKLKCKIIAGSANNQLLEEGDAYLLHERGIIYAPDYVVNAGGLIRVGFEWLNNKDPIKYPKPEELTEQKINDIYITLKNIFKVSQDTNTPTQIVADKLAGEIIKEAKTKANKENNPYAYYDELTGLGYL